MHCRGVVTMLVLAGAILPGTAAGATIGGTVWSDANANGLRDKGEPGLRAVAVAVQRRSGRTYRTVTTKLTGRTGTWSYTIGRAGTYRAKLTLPAGTRLAPADKDRRDRLDSDVKLTARQALTPARRLTRRGRSARFDAGLIPASARPPAASLAPPAALAPAAASPAPAAPLPPAPPLPTIGDRVWNDGDDDGLYDPAEPGLGGVAVEVWNADRTTRLASTVSAADGTWSLPASGTVRVRVLLPGAASYTYKGVGADSAADSDINWAGTDTGFSDPVTVDADRTDLDIGLRFPGMVSVGNRLWKDEDDDGIQDAGETSTSFLSAKKVELWNANLTQKLDEDTTSNTGAWSLQVPRYMQFRIRLAVPVTTLPSPAFQGADDALDSNFVYESDTSSVTPPASVSASNATIDAGVSPAFSMGNRVWRDLDENGLQDEGEPGIAGVTVQAWTTSPFEEVKTTTTNANGSYELSLKIPHSYRVRFLRPDGLTWTVKNAGSDDQDDSDANQAAVANPGFTDVYTPTEFTISTTSWDAGFVPE